MISKYLVIILLIFSFSFVCSIDGSSQVSFYAGSYSCVSSPSESYWQSALNQNIFLILNSAKSVFGQCNNSAYSTIWCCPTGMACFDGSCGLNKKGKNVHDCSDLYTKESCIHAPLALSSIVIESDVGWGGACSRPSVSYSSGGNLCANVSYCNCVWDESASTCGATWVLENKCNDGLALPTTIKSCTWTLFSSEDKCDEPDGKMTVTYSASDPTCGEKVKEYSCEVSTVLPFFDKFSFIFSILAIVGIYFFTRRK
ncbi:MAG: hypothetical protein WCI72_00375 [archaeon]